jgi:hypothetical protein
MMFAGKVVRIYGKVNEGPKGLNEGPQELNEGPQELNEGPQELNEGPNELVPTRLVPPKQSPTWVIVFANSLLKDPTVVAHSRLAIPRAWLPVPSSIHRHKAVPCANVYQMQQAHPHQHHIPQQHLQQHPQQQQQQQQQQQHMHMQHLQHLQMMQKQQHTVCLPFEEKPPYVR